MKTDANVKSRSIPKRRMHVIDGLVKRLVEKRVNSRNGKCMLKERANHACFVLEERGGIKVRAITYGENSFRKRHFVSIHAEQNALKKMKKGGMHMNGIGRRYSILVIKISNCGTHFGPSSCCNRCQTHISLAPINISRVYFSTPSGIVMQKPCELKSHVCGFDRGIQRIRADMEDMEVTESDDPFLDGKTRFAKQ